MPPPPTTTTLEADIAFNAANLALSKSQRLLASWFSPPPQSQSHTATDELITPGNQQEQKVQEKEEHELFTSLPELAGLGATGEGKENKGRREQKEGDEKLRKMLFGSGGGRGRAIVDKVNLNGLGTGRREDGPAMRVGGTKTHPITSQLPSRRGRRERGYSTDDEDDEGGRSSLGKVRKRPREQQRREEPAFAAADDNKNNNGIEETENVAPDHRASKEVEKESQRLEASKKRRGGTNYLDEVLAERLQKKKKKGQKKGDRKDGDVDG